MQKIELEKVGIYDVEKVIRLADDVIRQMECNLIFYDEKGIPLDTKSIEESGSYENADFTLQDEAHREKCFEIMRVIRGIIREKKPFGEIYYEDMRPIRDMVEPFRKIIIGLYRNGAEQDTVLNETNYCADESLSDDYLMELFVMRLRDRRIILAAQRLRE